MAAGKPFELLDFNDAPAERGGKPSHPGGCGSAPSHFNDAPAERGGKPGAAPSGHFQYTYFNDAPAERGGKLIANALDDPEEITSMMPPQNAGENARIRIRMLFTFLTSMMPPQNAGENSTSRNVVH